MMKLLKRPLEGGISPFLSRSCSEGSWLRHGFLGLALLCGSSALWGEGVTLEVRSDYPGTNPAPGIHTFPAGTVIEATAPAQISGGSGVRHSVTGWSRAVAHSPATIDGLQVWLDASDTATLTVESGAVSEWRDKSGNGFHARQAVAALRPLLKGDGLNGRPTVAFYQNVLELGPEAMAMASSVPGITIVGVTRGGGRVPDPFDGTIQDAASVVSISTAVNREHYRIRYYKFDTAANPGQVRGIGRRLDSQGGSGGSGNLSAPTRTNPGDTFFIDEAVFDYENTRAVLYQGGIQIAAMQPWATAGLSDSSLSREIAIGGHWFNTNARFGNFLDGEIAEIMIFNRPLGLEERERIAAYLTLKYGLDYRFELPTTGEGSSVAFTLDGPTTLEWHWATEHQVLAAANGNGSVEVRTTNRVPLLGWDMAPIGGSGAESVVSNTVAPYLEPSTLTRGPFDEEAGMGLRPATLTAGGFSSSYWIHTPSLDAAIAKDKYLQFGVKPLAGHSVSLNSLFFHYRYTATGPHSLALLYSTDNFATYKVAESVRIQDQASGTQLASRTFLFPDDPILQNVTNEITFRIYGWGGTGSGVGTFAILNGEGPGFDDMILYGGTVTNTSVTGTESVWLPPAALVQVEALPFPNNIFVGWSGSFFSNRSELRGLDLRQPLIFTATFAADSDGDGIPDNWKIQHFGNLSAAAEGDPDNDGFTNKEEYLRGSDPTQAEELLAAGDIPLSVWENPQRDPVLPGGFIIRDFGMGYRGVWEGSNHSRSALDPHHPDGLVVPAVDNTSFDGPRMIVRAEHWENEWKDSTIETIFSVGDDDGNCIYLRYQDELNYYRISIAGEISNATTRPRFGISVQKRVNGVYSHVLVPFEQVGTDPTDINYYKRIRVQVTANGPQFDVGVAGWTPSTNSWEGPGSWGYAGFSFTDSDLPHGRAGIGTWAQGGAPSGTVHPAWNPVNAGTLFEKFTISRNNQVVFGDDWATAPLAAALPAGWTNAFAGISGLAGNWRLSAHGTIAQISTDGLPTSGTANRHSADADGPVLLAPAVDASHYILDLGIHPFQRGAVGFVFDYIDQDNYGRVLFVNTIPGFEGSMPTGVVVGRKQGGAWSDLFIGDTAFAYRLGQPFQVSLNRSGNQYIMTVAEHDRPGQVHRWQWNDSSAPSGSGRHGLTTWDNAHVHFLALEVYGAVVQAVEGIAITGIARTGETIVLTVDNPSGTAYQVQRTLDLNGTWETVATGQTGTTWSGPIPAGADRVFWRLTR
jgi:hypothetical protein